MTENFSLGSVAGVRIGINWSVVVIFLLITTGLAGGQFPAAYPDHPPLAYVAAGLAAGIVFFLSLLAHELAHALVARQHGVGVDGITLWLFGGIARLQGEAADWRADLRIAGVGPLVSLAVAAVFLAAAGAAELADTAELLAGALFWLGAINVVLAVFNLVPAAPLDGGRVLRALLWRRSGDRTRAAIRAAQAGRGFGWVLVALGLVQFVGWGLVSTLWWVLIGWFIINAAGAEEQHVRMTAALHGQPVARVMSRDPVTAPDHISVQELVDDYVLGHRVSTFPIVDANGSPTGLVTLRRVKQLAADQRPTTPVTEIACPMSEVAVTGPDEPLADLLTKVTSCADERALVIADGRLVGIVSPSDITRQLDMSELRPGPSQLTHA